MFGCGRIVQLFVRRNHRAATCFQWKSLLEPGVWLWKTNKKQRSILNKNARLSLLASNSWKRIISKKCTNQTLRLKENKHKQIIPEPCPQALCSVRCLKQGNQDLHFTLHGRCQITRKRIKIVKYAKNTFIQANMTPASRRHTQKLTPKKRATISMLETEV